MASTTLFAPQVRAVQPAFVYNAGETSKVKVYFNLSSYNTVNNVGYILYTIIDPNKASTWGTNSVIEAAAAPAGYLYVNLLSSTETASVPKANRLYYTVEDEKYVYKGKLSSFETGKDYYYFNQDPDTGEFYIEINLGDSDNFKELTKNQFYQVQLYLCDKETSTPITTNKINNEWLDANKNNISVASQVTLIRPIPELAKTVFDLPSTIYNLSVLKGRIEYSDSSDIETIETCSLSIRKLTSDGLVSLPTITIKNQLGLNFEIPIKENLEVPKNDTVNSRLRMFTVLYKTKHGYEGSFSRNLSFTKYEYGDNANRMSMLFEPPCIAYSGTSGEILQRKSFESDNWETLNEPSLEEEWYYYDYNIAHLDKYKYRVLKDSAVQFCADNNGNTSFLVSFDDIFLSDTDTMLAVRYNPNISGYKYVTQEAITNTLGGKYPVIRKNGDTRYKQFNLSGTLYMNASTYNQEITSNNKPSGYDNWSASVKAWFNNDKDCSLYIKDENIIKSYTTKEKLERQARELAIDFLTNGKPKLFRSPEEGNMIVHLSNISFTPNKQLGRAVWDFSATVTEVCEYNIENINKYELNDGRQFQSALKFATPSQRGSVMSVPNLEED